MQARSNRGTMYLYEFSKGKIFISYTNTITAAIIKTPQINPVSVKAELAISSFTDSELSAAIESSAFKAY